MMLSTDAVLKGVGPVRYLLLSPSKCFMIALNILITHDALRGGPSRLKLTPPIFLPMTSSSAESSLGKPLILLTYTLLCISYSTSILIHCILDLGTQSRSTPARWREMRKTCRHPVRSHPPDQALIHPSELLFGSLPVPQLLAKCLQFLREYLLIPLWTR